MKKIVIYESATGFTKKYAQWIAEELQAEIKDIRTMNGVNLTEYDLVVFGGWLMGGRISGLEKIQKQNVKKLVVFATGASLDTKELAEEIRNANSLSGIPFFYLPGGMHYSQLGFMKKTMLKMVKKSITKKENKTEAELHMEKVICTDFDMTDRKYITPLLEACEERE